MSTEKSDGTRYKGFDCSKVSYDSKKEARKAARALSKAKGPNKYEPYRCHDCASWHIATSNRKQIKHNKQHSRGGRRGRRGRRKNINRRRR